MSTYVEKAEALFAQGYNCAQAVFGAFAQEYGMDDETALRVASSLGGGLGHTGNVCGALLGMALAIGMAKGYVDASDISVKTEHSARIRRMVEAFQAKFGATGCAELVVTGNRTACIPYIQYAVELVERERL